MDAQQDRLANPLGMDEGCTNCPALARARERVVHGYGEVDADFVFVGDEPSEGAERTGVPFTGDERGRAFQSILVEAGFADSPPDTPQPSLSNVYLTYLTRCRHPDRESTEREVVNCDPFLTAELRMINPEVIVPVGERALRAIVTEYTTESPAATDIDRDHAREIRGRGFELLPMRDPAELTDTDRSTYLAALRELLGRNYRQTKGRRGREEQSRD